jgi:hypothetical protein
MRIKTSIIPAEPTYVGIEDSLDLKAICIFAATGFFLEKDSYYKGIKCLQPGTIVEVEQQKILSEKKWFTWHYSPERMTEEEATMEFASIFERIVKEDTLGKTAILPLSGGLDSRTLATALFASGIKTEAYSYEFPHGIQETRYAKKIVRSTHFGMHAWQVPVGYLWNCIEDLAKTIKCQTDFTFPRSIAFQDHYRDLGDVFLLGHWGDVLFDNEHVADGVSQEMLVDLLFKKVIKKGGLDLAKGLWRAWGLDHDFESYLYQRLSDLCHRIDIENPNAAVRAFKSLYWAPRWTSANLGIFDQCHPISLPYYHEEMCRFICKVPENYLADRKIQINYIKTRTPELAAIPWQAQRPFNLNNYRFNAMPFNFPYRVYRKLRYEVKKKLGIPLVQRNWEIQFLGKENQEHLKRWLLENPAFSSFLPETMVQDHLDRFNRNPTPETAHRVGILLTLSLFTHTQKELRFV